MGRWRHFKDRMELLKFLIIMSISIRLTMHNKQQNTYNCFLTPIFEFVGALNPLYTNYITIYK